MNSGSVLKLDRVSLLYGDRRILDRLDVDIRSGSRTIIAGENGAGKTSLLKIALGLMEPSAGSVELFGLAPRTLSRRGERHRAAYVHQGAIRIEFPVSAREVVAIGTSGRWMSRTARNTIITESMERTGCGTIADRPYRVLSGGEKQKVSIARCLCQEPSLLLLDEPCSSLDPQASDEIMELLESFSDRVSIVMVSHFTEHLARPGWRVLTLHAGALE